MGLNVRQILDNVNTYKECLGAVRNCCLQEFLNDISCSLTCSMCDFNMQGEKCEEIEKWV